MHRFLVDTETLRETSPVLNKDAAKHLKVLRPDDGEKFELFDGRGSWRIYAYDAAAKSLVADQPSTSNLQPPTSNLTLFACVTKGSRWDWTVEKATELGVTRIVPVISARTIVRIPAAERAAKRERWLRIAEDAARQSDAKWLPEIYEIVDFEASLELVKATTCFIGALTEPPSPPLAKAVASRGGRDCAATTDSAATTEYAVYVGPEGDFTPEELAALMKIAIPTSFGPTVLRAETAAIYAVSALRSFL